MKPRKPVKFHSLGGVKYRIDVDEPFYGICEYGGDGPAIRLPQGLPCGGGKAAKQGLWNLLHECLHAENKHLSEDRVDSMAKDIHNLLWRLGYRREARAS